tara:strand:+ start:845 stop:1006 length:162 start_codon:yes stop_codon:yes gene_type:complete
MEYGDFKHEALQLGFNLDEFTMMDAYAEYEVTNKTIEACIETILDEELDYQIN